VRGVLRTIHFITGNPEVGQTIQFHWLSKSAKIPYTLTHCHLGANRQAKQAWQQTWGTKKAAIDMKRKSSSIPYENPLLGRDETTLIFDLSEEIQQSNEKEEKERDQINGMRGVR
jgi:hypothetical protein